MASIMKEFHKLIQRADKLYDGQVEFDMEVGRRVKDDEENEDGDDENYVDIYFFVTPKEGPYRRAKIEFHMRVDVNRYPCDAPEVTCLNKIFHPNINIPDEYTEGEICVNVLGSDWEPEIGLDGAVMAVLFLLHNPELDDALNPICSGYEDYGAYEASVRRALLGEDIDEYEFDKLIDDLTDTEDNEEVGEGIKTDTATSIIGEVKKDGDVDAGATSDDIDVATKDGKVDSQTIISDVDNVDGGVTHRPSTENDDSGEAVVDTQATEHVKSDDVLQTTTTENGEVNAQIEKVELNTTTETGEVSATTENGEMNTVTEKGELGDDVATSLLPPASTIAAVVSTTTKTVSTETTNEIGSRSSTEVTRTTVITTNTRWNYHTFVPLSKNTVKTAIKNWFLKFRNRISPFCSTLRRRS